MVGTKTHPKPPFPPERQEKPGLESRMRPRPQYKAPEYRGADKLAGCAALITGGDSGIGRAVAVLFAREGADVAIVYLPEEESDARTTERAVENESRTALLIPGDVRDPKFCESAVKRTVEKFKRLDVLVNNAAYSTASKIDRGRARGQQKLLDYSATKGAIHAFTKSLAQNLIEKHVRVNCVSPGPVWTPLNPSDKDPKQTATFGSDTPMKRPAQPEEIAPAFVFFASNHDSSYVTGEVLTLLGGETTAA
jgi:NAD(P)-dependent dehydrogenase (short-subunit alcohol dehydrogenase family)